MDMDLVRLRRQASRSDYHDSPRNPRRSRKNSHNVPPHAPDVPGDDEPVSPPRRMARERSRYRDRDSDWDRHQDDDILRSTPESRASSSSYHASHPRYYGSDSRRDPSTNPSHSIASSITSVATPHPPRSSATRQSSVVYRRPSVNIKDLPSLGYDDQVVRERPRGHSQSRSICAVPIVPTPPQSRSMSRSRAPAYASSSPDSGDEDTEEAYHSHDDQRSARSHRETQLVRIRRDERSRSRADTSRLSSHQSGRHGNPPGRHVEDHDETDSRDYSSPDERTRRRVPSHQPSRPPSRPQSRAASVRHIHAGGNDHEHDADSDEPPVRRHSDHREHHGSHKDRHSPRTSRDHRRNRSESHSKLPPPKRSASKQYYESEQRSIEKRGTYHPPSSSHRRSKTISGPASMAAPQHQSVSSTKRSSILGSFFGSSHYGPPQHHVPAKPTKLYDCVVCLDELPARKMAKLKCSHRMCNSCLKRAFKLSIMDPQHMPPKCCTADFVPLKHVDQLFDRNFKKTWNKKFVEYSARNRVYCPRRSCGEFIRPEDIRRGSDGKKIGQCAKCSTKVCVKCASKAHKGDCPRDEETVRFLAQAKDEGWQRCLKCKAVIELQEGCNHMTCRCGAEFCYVCGGPWKTCECPWFNYESVEADRVLHMQVPRNPARPTVDIPLTPPREGRLLGLRQPQTYEEELRHRRIQLEHDERYARGLQDWREDDRDDFRDGFGDITALGNAAGHFMNEDYRLRPRMAHPPPAPHGPMEPAPMFDRTPADDYIHGVNRARGVGGRANSMTRLADRFVPRPPPPMPTAATMPLPDTMAPRRHTVEVAEVGSRTVERPSGRVMVRPVMHEEPGEMMTPAVGPGNKVVPVVRKQHVREAPKGPVLSALAGLTQGGSYEKRVSEWRMYVGGGGMLEPTAELAS